MTDDSTPHREPTVAIDFVEEQLELFPTRFVHRRFSGVESLNARLTETILQQEASDPGLQRSNQGGWHSTADFLSWPQPEIKVLIELLRTGVERYMGFETGQEPGTFELTLEMEGWANVSRKGAYNRLHVHPGAHLAVVYYVAAGDVLAYPAGGRPDPSGAIEFLDPRNRVQMLPGPGLDQRDTFTVYPESGALLVFPSWMYHSVHPYQGEKPRISISVNVAIRALKTPGVAAKG